MATETPKPLPCPFCGAIPEDDQPSGYIFCPNGYDFMADKPIENACPLTYGMPLEKWNRRSALSQRPGETDAAEGLGYSVAEYDADLAYWQQHVEGTRRDTLNPSEYPALDAEIIRIKRLRLLVPLVAKITTRDTELLDDLADMVPKHSLHEEERDGLRDLATRLRDAFAAIGALEISAWHAEDRPDGN